MHTQVCHPAKNLQVTKVFPTAAAMWLTSHTESVACILKPATRPERCSRGNSRQLVKRPAPGQVAVEPQPSII